jgi:hypothetical protein
LTYNRSRRSARSQKTAYRLTVILAALKKGLSAMLKTNYGEIVDKIHLSMRDHYDSRESLTGQAPFELNEISSITFFSMCTLSGGFNSYRTSQITTYFSE